jgi:Xaa-Pro aminopeptidase
LDTVGHGVPETEVNAVGTAAAMRAGADFVRYLRVHSGPWSGFGSRWPQASDRQMLKGDLVALDIIGAVQGYGFDVLRTTIVGWDTLPEQRAMCEVVLHAVAAALDKARAGVTCGELVRVGLKVMEKAGYGEYANRFMGHGIGLETVEAPLLVPDSEVVLKPGMVLCIEPGIFIRGKAGCSIEEEVIITEDGSVVTTDVSRRLWE